MEDQVRLSLTICDCLLTFAEVKLNHSVKFNLKKIKVNIVEERYFGYFGKETLDGDLKRLELYSKEFSRTINELFKKLLDSLYSYKILLQF